jgi:alanine dehydrogenase
VYISAEEIYKELSMTECIQAMEKAFELLHQNVSIHSLRKRVHLPGGTIAWGNLMSLMPAYYDEEYCGAKVFTVYPDNSGTELPTHQGLVLLFNSRNGSLLACAEANAITELRTAATTALATKLLSRPDAAIGAFVGAGPLAYSHLRALMLVRPFSRIQVFDINQERAHQFAQYAKEQYGVEAVATPNMRAATKDADVVTTATTAGKPILFLDDVRPGVHINALGACAPVFRELATDLVCAARFFGDCREAVLNEPGDFLIPIQEHQIDASHLKGDLSDLVGGMQGRTSESDITIFESLGIANEDVAAVRWIYEKRKQNGQV